MFFIQIKRSVRSNIARWQRNKAKMLKCYAIEGNFDDAQSQVKSLFLDETIAMNMRKTGNVHLDQCQFY